MACDIGRRTLREGKFGMSKSLIQKLGLLGVIGFFFVLVCSAVFTHGVSWL